MSAQVKANVNKRIRSQSSVFRRLGEEDGERGVRSRANVAAFVDSTRSPVIPTTRQWFIPRHGVVHDMRESFNVLYFHVPMLKRRGGVSWNS